MLFYFKRVCLGKQISSRHRRRMEDIQKYCVSTQMTKTVKKSAPYRAGVGRGGDKARYLTMRSPAMPI